MMISQPATVEIEPVLNATKIFGMDVMTASLVLIIMALLGYIAGRLWWDRYKRNKNIEDAKDSVELIIVPIEGGKIRRVLAKAFQGEAKEITNESKGTFLNTWFAKPEKGEVEPYQLWAGFNYTDDWPQDAPESQRVPVMAWFFHEGDTAPKLPHDEERYNVDRVTKQSTAFSRYSRETSVAATMLGQFSGFFNDLIASLPLLKKINLVFIMQIVTCAGIAALVYFAFMNNGNVATIIKALPKP